MAVPWPFHFEKNALDGGISTKCSNSRWEALLHKWGMENEEGVNVPWKSEYLLAPVGEGS